MMEFVTPDCAPSIMLVFAVFQVSFFLITNRKECISAADLGGFTRCSSPQLLKVLLVQHSFTHLAIPLVWALV